MRLHPRLVMFEDMAMVHPFSRAVVRYPGNLRLAPRRKIHRILPRAILGRLAIQLEDLKEESVKMKGVVHEAYVRHFPHLKLSYIHRFVHRVKLPVHGKINSIAKAWVDSQSYCAGYFGVPARERFDAPHDLRNVCA